MAAALYRDIPIFEYSPRKVKQSITGRGNASKDQVSAMINTLFAFHEQPKYFDATDAVAVACCHYFQKSPGENRSKVKGWAGYLRENHDRII